MQQDATNIQTCKHNYNKIYTYLRSWLVQPKKLKGTEVIFSTSFLAVNCINYEKKKEKKNPHFVPFFGLTSQKENCK